MDSTQLEIFRLVHPSLSDGRGGGGFGCHPPTGFSNFSRELVSSLRHLSIKKFSDLTNRLASFQP